MNSLNAYSSSFTQNFQAMPEMPSGSFHVICETNAEGWHLCVISEPAREVITEPRWHICVMCNVTLLPAVVRSFYTCVMPPSFV